jgi:lipopolysaccharide transport system ATP-binding protein
MDLFSAPARRFRELSGGIKAKNEFWALKGVDFEIKQGEVFGLVGRNGAGKSTLLKILSRITAPTEGRVLLRGRAASLLEVGTGFHPELSGRENIYLNGSILGMTRGEIDKKFDEIVDFAGIEKFLDTPVKRYSSGMYVRLAFAVAAHLEPEILLVDEVLAVGDQEFQKKCIGRMKSLAGGSATIVFVSHNMGAIQALCDRCLLLDQGRSIEVGPTMEIVSKYASQVTAQQSFARDIVIGDNPAIQRADLSTLMPSEDDPRWRLRISMTVASPKKMRVAIALRVKDTMAAPIAFASCGHLGPDEMIELKVGDNPVTLEMPLEFLALGDYTVTLHLSIPFVTEIEELDDCLSFHVERSARANATQALSQSWGCGSIELPLRYLERGT